MSKGICPVCNGTKQRPCPDNLRKYGISNGWYGYRAEDDTVKCNNCGGQYMFSRPSGVVRLNNDGVPCTHEYTNKSSGQHLTPYTCKHCADQYSTDSGD